MEKGRHPDMAKKIMNKILSEVKRYDEAIKNDKEFSEAIEIRYKIKKLVKELKGLYLFSDMPMTSDN